MAKMFYTLEEVAQKLGKSEDEVREMASKGLEPVGLIILVTGAGGVFGKVLFILLVLQGFLFDNEEMICTMF